jgi:hypothetical protein
MSKPDSMWPIIAIILAGAVVVLANNARKNNQSLEAWIEDLENQQHKPGGRQRITISKNLFSGIKAV